MATGRPTKRTPAVVGRLLSALRSGNTRRTACIYAGIDESTFQRWNKADAVFAAEVKGVEEEAVLRNVAHINVAAAKSWQAAAWWLERRLPQEWGRIDRLAVSGDPTGPPVVFSVDIPDNGRPPKVSA